MSVSEFFHIPYLYVADVNHHILIYCVEATKKDPERSTDEAPDESLREMNTLQITNTVNPQAPPRMNYSYKFFDALF